MEMVCMACGKKANVTAEQIRSGSYRCPGCHRQIRILNPDQAKSLVRELRSVYMLHAGRGRVKTTRTLPAKPARRVAAKKK